MANITRAGGEPYSKTQHRIASLRRLAVGGRCPKIPAPKRNRASYCLVRAGDVKVRQMAQGLQTSQRRTHRGGSHRSCNNPWHYCKPDTRTQSDGSSRNCREPRLEESPAHPGFGGTETEESGKQHAEAADPTPPPADLESDPAGEKAAPSGEMILAEFERLLQLDQECAFLPRPNLPMRVRRKTRKSRNSGSIQLVAGNRSGTFARTSSDPPCRKTNGRRREMWIGKTLTTTATQSER